MFLGYNTNGLAHHGLFDAVELLAEIGYRGVAITIDHNALPPGDCPNFRGHRGEPWSTKMGLSPLATAKAASGSRGCGVCWKSSTCDRSSRPVPGFSWTRGRSTSRRCCPNRRAAGSTSTNMPSISPPHWAAIACRSGRERGRRWLSARILGNRTILPDNHVRPPRTANNYGPSGRRPA